MQIILGKLHIQISRYGELNKDRYYKLYTRRRKKGFCVQCGERVTEINDRTGLLKRKCRKCLDAENKREREKRSLKNK